MKSYIKSNLENVVCLMFTLTSSNLADKSAFPRSLNIEENHLCPEISATFAVSAYISKIFYK